MVTERSCGEYASLDMFKSPTKASILKGKRINPLGSAILPPLTHYLTNWL